MAEYKYRALGWKDDDIASLNVVDGKAADNQVELQITKQGAGTIDGPAIVGKDGITINKAADSEKIEISGKGCVQNSSKKGYVVYTRENDVNGSRTFATQPVPNSFPIWNTNNELEGNISNSSTDYTLTNKKYVDDNYVKKDTSAANQQVYGHDVNGDPQMFYVTTGNSNPYWLCKYQDSTSGATEPTGNGRLITQDPTQPYQAANKHYVDETDKNLRLKLSNLEQTLNGYILDTTKEAYADLDSAVLKDSVALGDNVYPIADKTRALVSRIEGKTTKMVQLFDKSVIPATSTVSGITYTNNNDGSITINGTATAESLIIVVIREKITNGHKILYGSEQNTSDYGVAWGTNLSSSKFDTSAVSNNYTVIVKSGVTVNNVKIYPQLFDLTAMGREDITTAEQFKAEFPDLYPYENGNIYPAKISGVKFTGKNLLKLELEPSLNAYNATASINGDILSITPTITEPKTCYAQLKTHLKAGKYTFSAVINNPNNVSTQFILSKKINAVDIVFQRYYTAPVTFTIDEEQDFYILIYPIVKAIAPFKTASYQMQIQAGSQATPYEPYIEPVSVTLPETYDLHGIGNYKDYLEITKNEDNELYTLKKVQVIDKHVFDGTEAWTVSGRVLPICKVFYTFAVKCLFVYEGKGGLSNNLPLGTWNNDIEHIQFGQNNDFIYVFLNKEKFTTGSDVQEYLAAQYASGNPLIAYYILPTPVETVIATNFTYEQVTAVRHNGGLIEVEGNTNKGYAKPTVTNTIVYRLTASTTVDGTSIVKDTDGKIQLNQEYIDYLDNQLYQPPAISVFTMLDAAGAALPTSNELGTTLSAASFNHQETNIKNIQGDNVELHINNAVAATTSTAKKDVATKVTLTTAQSITSSTKFTLKGTNTKGAAFSRDYQVNFYRYAYTATTDATTAPTSGATQQAAVSTFASNGSTFNYTKGAYIYFYTDNTGKKVQTNVLGQWADVDTTDMGKVTLTQSNGATHEYTCYRIGPFIETGSAKYRV